jgi:DNA replication and repair protein RecF
MAAHLHIQSLKLTHFKSYAEGQFVFSPRINCLVGFNGVGKTNVLDAIHFLCLTKSHRSMPDKHLVRHGSDFLRVEGVFEREARLRKVVVKMAAEKRKEWEVDGTSVERLADHIGQFPAVMIAPDDVSLVQEGSEERRRYLDGALSQISTDYLKNLMLFNALLKQRNALLKSFGEQKRFEPLLLDAIDRQMPAPAAAIHHARREMATAIAPIFEAIYASISGEKEQAAFQLNSDWPADGDYLSQLLSARDRDRYAERTQFGPHRDDLELMLDLQPVKRFASQGQLKSYLLALRLAQYEYLRAGTGVAPILLLDDIFDKLDVLRVRQLVGLLIDRQVGQVFMTDTQQERMEAAVAPFGADYRIIAL